MCWRRRESSSNKIDTGLATDAGSPGSLMHDVNRYRDGFGIFDASQCRVIIYVSNTSRLQLSGVLEAWCLGTVSLYLHL